MENSRNYNGYTKDKARNKAKVVHRLFLKSGEELN